MFRAPFVACCLGLVASACLTDSVASADRYGNSSSSSSSASNSAAAAFDNLDTPPTPQALEPYSRSSTASSDRGSRYGNAAPAKNNAKPPTTNSRNPSQQKASARDAFSGVLSSNGPGSTQRQPSGNRPSKPRSKPSQNAGSSSNLRQPAYGSSPVASGSGNSRISNPYQNNRFGNNQSRSSRPQSSSINPLRDNSSSNRRATSSSSASSPRNDKPNRLMRAMMTAPSGSQLSGSPYHLSQVLSSTNSRQEQSSRITAYWDLCSSVADYYLGLREAAELSSLRRRVPKLSEPLRQAEADLRIRLGTSLRAARSSQKRLANAIGGATILPADLPHCGAYQTRYAQLFANRGSAEARELHELLPLRHAELQKAANAVLRAEKWVEQIDGRSGPDSDRTAVLRSLELLALNRRAFVQIARDYNRRISRYTELSTPGNIDDGRLVAMLIGRRGNVIATQPSDRSPYSRTR